MDSQSKTGKVYLRPQKAGKKWKPVWMSLFPPSSNGLGRLEIQDMGGTIGDHGMRRYQALGERKPKVIRLSELLNVLKLPPNAEACPMDNMCAFCVETQERTLVFAALKEDCVEWVEKLCQNTFKKSVVPESNKAQMEENVIYASTDDVSTGFRVVVQNTDAATRCGLQGAYWLQIGREALLIKDSQKTLVREWPYEFLRRYGKDQSILTIETGRRCDCGPATIIFETSQAEQIFSLIQSTIKRKTTSTAHSARHSLDMEKSLIPNIQAHSPLPKTPDMNSMAAILENKLRTNDETDDSATSHPAPITLMPLPSLPHQDAIPKSGADNIYADPLECVKSHNVCTALYVDPASILPLQPPVNAEPSTHKKDSLYSEVFDKISPSQNKLNVIPTQHGGQRFADDEPIYSEPVQEAPKVSPRVSPKVSPKVERKVDPFAHLYAQVCKTPKRSSSPNPTSESKETDQSNDVIYENLGVI